MTEYHSYEKLETAGKGWKVIAGTFAPAGTGAPTYICNRGWTVARASAGVWTVTIDTPFEGFAVYPVVGLTMATGDTDVHDINGGDFSISGRTFDIEHKLSADTTATHPVAADIAAHADNVVSFFVIVAENDVMGSGLA